MHSLGGCVRIDIFDIVVLVVLVVRLLSHVLGVGASLIFFWLELLELVSCSLLEEESSFSSMNVIDIFILELFKRIVLDDDDDDDLIRGIGLFLLLLFLFRRIEDDNTDDEDAINAILLDAIIVVVGILFL